MRKLLPALVLLGVGLFTFQAGAKPAVACRPQDETLLADVLQLASDGQSLRSSNGTFITDAGVQLYAGTEVTIDAVNEPGAACQTSAKQVKVTFDDPWTGERRELTLGETP